MKWYQKLLIALAVVVFSPLIIVAVLIGGISLLFQIPKYKKEYKSSLYYKRFGLPFMTCRLYSPEYRFYNNIEKRNISVDYVRQESNGLEYFIFDDMLFIFPDFDQIDYDDERSEWQADFDGDWVNFERSYQNLVSKIDIDAPKLPVKLLVERKMFPLADLNGVELPECIFLTWSYETAFENEDSPLKMIIPQSSKDLYEMMLATPDLCGSFELGDDNLIHWDLYGNIQIELGVDPRDCYLGVNKKVSGKIESDITHWHPTAFEIYNEVCKIGTRGNVLVIRAFASGAEVLYMGDENNCPYSPDQNTSLGKIYYLKAK